METFINAITGLKIKTRIRDDDTVDQLQHFFTVYLLAAFAILVGIKEYTVGQLDCYYNNVTSKHFQDHANTYCWTHKLYKFPNPENLSQVPYPLSSDSGGPANSTILGADDGEIVFYRWITVLFLCQVRTLRTVNFKLIITALVTLPHMHSLPILQQVCSLEALEPGEEWLQVPTDCYTSFSVCTQLDRKCRQENPAGVGAEVQALIFENSLEGDDVIYTDGSVVPQVRSSWAFTAQAGGRIVKEDSGAFVLSTSSLTMEVMAVSKAITWLETQTFTRACFLSDSMSMLRKIEMVDPKGVVAVPGAVSAGKV